MWFSSCFLCLEFFELLGYVVYNFHQTWIFFSHSFFKYFFLCLTFSSHLRTAITHIIGYLKLFQSSSVLFSFYSPLFSVSFWIFSTASYASSLILSCTMSNLFNLTSISYLRYFYFSFPEFHLKFLYFPCLYLTFLILDIPHLYLTYLLKHVYSNSLNIFDS